MTAPNPARVAAMALKGGSGLSLKEQVRAYFEEVISHLAKEWGSKKSQIMGDGREKFMEWKLGFVIDPESNIFDRQVILSPLRGDMIPFRVIEITDPRQMSTETLAEGSISINQSSVEAARVILGAVESAGYNPY